MATIKFSDGMQIDTDGPYRVIRKSDGLYVIGHGYLCAVDDSEEGVRMIRDLGGEDKGEKENP